MLSPVIIAIYILFYVLIDFTNDIPNWGFCEFYVIAYPESGEGASLKRYYIKTEERSPRNQC